MYLKKIIGFPSSPMVLLELSFNESYGHINLKRYCHNKSKFRTNMRPSGGRIANNPPLGFLKITIDLDIAYLNDSTTCGCVVCRDTMATWLCATSLLQTHRCCMPYNPSSLCKMMGIAHWI